MKIEEYSRGWGKFCVVSFSIPMIILREETTRMNYFFTNTYGTIRNFVAKENVFHATGLKDQKG